MIARYFKDSFAESIEGQNAMWDTLLQFVGAADTSRLTNPQEGIEATTQILAMQKTPPHAMDIAMIQNALMEMLLDIKFGIQTHTPTTELATRQLTQAVIWRLKHNQAHPWRIVYGPKL